MPANAGVGPSYSSTGWVLTEVLRHCHVLKHDRQASNKRRMHSSAHAPLLPCTQALNETFRMAQQAGDAACTAQALGVLCR